MYERLGGERGSAGAVSRGNDAGHATRTHWGKNSRTEQKNMRKRVKKKKINEIQNVE